MEGHGLAMGFMALAAPVADAGTVRILETNPGRYALLYDGDAGANTVSITREAGTLTLTDTSATTSPGVNCQAGPGASVQCAAPGDGVVEITQYLTDAGDDRVEVDFTGRSDGGPMDNNFGGDEDGSAAGDRTATAPRWIALTRPQDAE